MRRHLDRWQAAGARRFVDFRELAGAITRRLRITRHGAGWVLEVGPGDAPPLVRPVPITVRFAADTVPARVGVLRGGSRADVAVENRGDGLASLLLPAETALTSSSAAGSGRVTGAARVS